MIEDLKKPKLPRALMQVSLLGSVGFIAYALAMFVVPSFACWRVWQSALPLVAKLALSAVLVVMSGQGLHLLGWVGHEGWHFNLSRNKKLSAFVGTLFGSMVVSFFTVGMNLTHWDHHRFTNKPGDPDCALFSPHKTLWSRFVVARLALNRTHIRNVMRLIARRPMAFQHTPFELPTMRIYALLNVIFQLGWLAVYVAVAVYDLRLAIVAIVAPHFVSFVLTAQRSYTEHAGTRAGMFVDARTRTSGLSSFLFFFNNYHLEHHLYPGVPCYRLRAVHRHLRASGVYDLVTDVAIAADHAAELRFAAPKYVYPVAE